MMSFWERLPEKYAVLKIPGFRLSLATKFFMTLGIQMQAVVIGWQIFRLTGDPLALGLIGLSEALPFIGVALWAGNYADRHEKRGIILLAEAGLLLCALLFLGLTLSGNRSLWLLYGVIGLTGLCRSFLWPAASVYIDTSVPRAIYSKAAGWNASLWQLGAIIGPLIGGWVYSIADAAHAYALVAVVLMTGIFFASRLAPKPPVPSDEKESGWERLTGGFRFVFAHQPIFAALALDMFAVLFGGVVILLPVFAERLGVGPAGLGVLKSATSVGALLMALYQSHRPAWRRTGLALLWSEFAFGLSIILFPFSQSFALSVALLAFSGAVDNISVVIRASILQAMTPDRLRGRVSSVNSIFIGSSNEIGAFESGVAAKLLGVVPSVVFGGLMTWLSAIVVAFAAPQLRRLKLGDVPHGAPPVEPPEIRRDA